MSRRILVPPTLAGPPPIGGGHLARPVWDFDGATMGTHWLARVVAPLNITHDDVTRIIVDALAFVVAYMSPWETSSDLSRHRAAEAGSWVEFAPDTLRVLTRALEIAGLTGGRYDPTVGRLVDTLGFGPADPALASAPDSLRANEARVATGHARLHVDPDAKAVLQPGGISIDLCSIAKGHAVDLVVERLRARGVEACFVEIGGEARGVGCKPDGNPWWCLLAPPHIEGHGLPPTVVAACDLAVATSGNNLRQRLLPDGAALGHIIDPLPGPARHLGLDSVTVLAPTCMDADAFATALFLLGTDDGLALAEREGIAALFVERDAFGFRERSSTAFAAFLG